MKSEVVHARVDSDVKMKAEEILEPIGLYVDKMNCFMAKNLWYNPFFVFIGIYT